VKARTSDRSIDRSRERDKRERPTASERGEKLGARSEWGLSSTLSRRRLGRATSRSRSIFSISQTNCGGTRVDSRMMLFAPACNRTTASFLHLSSFCRACNRTTIREARSLLSNDDDDDDDDDDDGEKVRRRRKGTTRSQVPVRRSSCFQILGARVCSPFATGGGEEGEANEVEDEEDEAEGGEGEEGETEKKYAVFNDVDVNGLPRVARGDQDRVCLVLHAHALRMLWAGLLEYPLEREISVYVQSTSWRENFARALGRQARLDGDQILEIDDILENTYTVVPSVIAVFPEGDVIKTSTLPVSSSSGTGTRPLSDAEGTLLLRAAVAAARKMKPEVRMQVAVDTQLLRVFRGEVDDTTVAADIVSSLESLGRDEADEERARIMKAVWPTAKQRRALSIAAAISTTRSAHRAEQRTKRDFVRIGVPRKTRGSVLRARACDVWCVVLQVSLDTGQGLRVPAPHPPLRGSARRRGARFQPDPRSGCGREPHLWSRAR
jgi:hypothetical protein